MNKKVGNREEFCDRDGIHRFELRDKSTRGKSEVDLSTITQSSRSDKGERSKELDDYGQRESVSNRSERGEQRGKSLTEMGEFARIRMNVHLLLQW